MKKIRVSLAALASAAAAGPAMAQTEAVTEEIIIEGRYGTVPDSVKSLSQAVSYADLDLSTQAGRDVLRQRVKLTARFLCNRLGEADSSGPVVPSCQQEAVRSAMTRVGTIEEGFAPRGTAWVSPPAWIAPYPADWATRTP